MPFCKEMESAGGGGGLTALASMLGPQGLKGLEMVGPVECRGYGVTLTPWWCIENQLSDFCLPGFPCHTCEAGVTIIPAAPQKDHRLQVKDHRLQTCATNRKPKMENRKRVLKGMSRAVARDLGLI